jgi:hypothetical protein
MARTLPVVRLMTAALVLFMAPAAWAQLADSDVPVYLLAHAAADSLNTADEAREPADQAAATMPARAIEAQPPNPLDRAPRMDVTGTRSRPLALPVLYATLGVLQGMDFYTTQKGMALGAHETNGLIRNGNSGTTMALKAASMATTIFIAEKMWKKNKAGAVALMVATNVMFGAVVANNARVIGQLQ